MVHRFRKALDGTSAVFMAGDGAGLDADPAPGDLPLGAQIAGLQKRFPQGRDTLDVLADITLDVPPGSFVSLLGPSGAGKSTLLGILAGLDAPSAGSITLYSAAGPVPGPRLGRIGYMPQRDLLLPWRTALGNAIAGLEVRGVPQPAAEQMAHRLFRAFDLEAFAGSYPRALSGGMRQRVALARSALAARGMLLLDEPFGALDALTRAAMQEWLLSVWNRLRTTIVLVTHDVDEAVLLADVVYVLTPRPARIAAREPIPIPRPRTLDVATSPEFAACKLHLLTALRAAGGLPGAASERPVRAGSQGRPERDGR